jgi:hypothetical protein
MLLFSSMRQVQVAGLHGFNAIPHKGRPLGDFLANPESQKLKPIIFSDSGSTG